MSSLQKAKKTNWVLPAILAVLVFALDQLTKILILHFWPETNRIYFTVIPGFFSLVHCQNQGAAWGIFAGHTWMLGCISAIAALAIIFCWRRLTAGRRFLEICYGILWGGIAGNMYDRFLRPGVIDFLHFYYRQWSWPAFNIADSAICCSIILIVIYNFFTDDGQASKKSKAHGKD